MVGAELGILEQPYRLIVAIQITDLLPCTKYRIGKLPARAVVEIVPSGIEYTIKNSQILLQLQAAKILIQLAQRRFRDSYRPVTLNHQLLTVLFEQRFQHHGNHRRGGPMT